MKRYTKEHEWVELEGDIALVGISKHAADELGDITFVELPAIGTDVIVGDPVTVVESVKAASDIYAPVSGTVKEVNISLEEDPGTINSSPEEEGWIYKLDNIDISEIDDLMDKAAYDKYLESD
jgi:glycine cleavage system H protein